VTDLEKGLPPVTPTNLLFEHCGLCQALFDTVRPYMALAHNHSCQVHPFLAVLGHELRNPLAPIRNAIHLIRTAGRNPELLESACAIAERQVARLAQLADNLTGMPADSRAIPGGAPQPPELPPRPQRILVVEDLLDEAITTELLLELLGHTVELAQDGPGALARVESFAPDIVLCDIGLPGNLDGYQVARAIRTTPSLDRVRLVALTGFGGPENRDRAVQAGFDAHLTKPVDPEALGPFIRRISAARGTS